MTTITIPPGSNLDPYLMANRINTRFVLGPGSYRLGTGWAFDKDHDHCCLGPDCELIGAGSRETFIYANPVRIPEGAKQIESLTAGSRSEYCESTVIRGLTLFAETLFAGGIGTEIDTNIGVIGIHTWACRTTIEDVVVHGVQGTRPDREGFGVLVNAPGEYIASDEFETQPVGGSRIENVEVTGRGYVCGVYIGYPRPAETSIARNIRVSSCGEGPAHAAFGTNGGVLWSNIQNTGRWNRAIFCDTAGGDGTIFSACRLQAEDVLVEFRGSCGVVWKDILVTDSFLETTCAPDRSDRTYAAALVLARDGGKPGPVFLNVGIQNCVIRATAPCDHYLGSIDSPGSDNGIFHSRLIGPGTWKSPILADGSNGFREYGILKV
jgi:hypothetical protein